MNHDQRSVLLDVGLLLIRLVLAVVFMFHGSQKIFGAFGGSGMQKFSETLTGLNVPMPTAAAWVAALTEFVGGIILVIGTGTRIAGLLLAINMAVAIILVHPNAFSAQNNGMEYPLTLGVVSLALVFTGPGRITLGRLFAGKRTTP